MDKNKTLIAVVLDSSGSMQPRQGETIAAVNGFVEEQRQLPGAALFLLVPFATDVRYPHRGPVPLADAPPITADTYSPTGWTALLDGIGITINRLGSYLARLPEAERPGKVIVVVMTDGEENWSKKFDAARIRSMVEHQTKKYNWEFVFLAAGLNAISVGTSYGFSGANTMSWEPERAGSVHAAYVSIGAVVRSSRVTGQSAGFSLVDRISNAPQAAASGALPVPPPKEDP